MPTIGNTQPMWHAQFLARDHMTWVIGNASVTVPDDPAKVRFYVQQREEVRYYSKLIGHEDASTSGSYTTHVRPRVQLDGIGG